VKEEAKAETSPTPLVFNSGYYPIFNFSSYSDPKFPLLFKPSLYDGRLPMSYLSLPFAYYSQPLIPGYGVQQQALNDCEVGQTDKYFKIIIDKEYYMKIYGK